MKVFIWFCHTLRHTLMQNKKRKINVFVHCAWVGVGVCMHAQRGDETDLTVKTVYWKNLWAFGWCWPFKFKLACCLYRQTPSLSMALSKADLWPTFLLIKAKACYCVWRCSKYRRNTTKYEGEREESYGQAREFRNGYSADSYANEHHLWYLIKVQLPLYEVRVELNSQVTLLINLVDIL